MKSERVSASAVPVNVFHCRDFATCPCSSGCTAPTRVWMGNENARPLAIWSGRPESTCAPSSCLEEGVPPPRTEPSNSGCRDPLSKQANSTSSARLRRCATSCPSAAPTSSRANGRLTTVYRPRPYGSGASSAPGNRDGGEGREPARVADALRSCRRLDDESSRAGFTASVSEIALARRPNAGSYRVNDANYVV